MRRHLLNDQAPSLDDAVLSVYQNEGHIGGLLQQMYRAGLLVSEDSEREGTRTSKSDLAISGEGKAAVNASVPMLGSIEASLGGGAGRTTAQANGETQAARRQYIFSQSYYLYHVRKFLKDQSWLKNLNQIEPEALAVGDFVEFSADFFVNDITSLLDIVTPDMASRLARSWYMRKNAKGFDDFGDFQKAQAQVLQLQHQGEALATAVEATAHAVHADFRSESTREFYAHVTRSNDSELTAIIPCESDSFTSNDLDRLLDGRFTVLGKVSSPLLENVSLLGRNKVLKRVNPDLVDWLMDQVRKVATQESFLDQLDQDVDNAEDEPDSVAAGFSGAIFDASFSARLQGRVLRILPIAIYL